MALLDVEAFAEGFGVEAGDPNATKRSSTDKESFSESAMWFLRSDQAGAS